MRTRDERRAERERVISKRLNIIKRVWQDEGYLAFASQRTGRFAKHNLKCTCRLCKQPRYDRARAKVQTERESVSA